MAFIPIPIEAESGSFAFTGIPADIMFTASARSGAQITTAGQYEVTFNLDIAEKHHHGIDIQYRFHDRNQLFIFQHLY